MLKKSSKEHQLDIFSSPSLFNVKAQTAYENPNGWHKLFRKEVVNRINEEILSPIYSNSQGRPNASIRVLIGMMFLKEAFGLSDEKIFEDCRYNLLYRSALGILNLRDNLPTESTYYLLRQKVAAYTNRTGKIYLKKYFRKRLRNNVLNLE